MALTQIPRGEHFGDSLTRWIGPEGGDSDFLTRSLHDRLAAGTQRVRLSKVDPRLAEKRLFPLNYTPKRPQSLKTTECVPVADFTWVNTR